MIETIKFVDGYGYDYLVGSKGNVYSRKKKGMVALKQKTDRKGYFFVGLYKNKKGRDFRVHRLMMCAFIDNPENKKTVNHIDGVKNNNNIKNLEWATHSENTRHAIKTGLLKLTGSRKKRVYAYKNNVFLGEFESTRVAGRFFNLSPTAVSHICTKKRNSAYGYTFEFAQSQEPNSGL